MKKGMPPFRLQAPDHLEDPSPLSAAEVAELDAYGPIDAFSILDDRGLELWEREILWGRLDRPREFGGLLSDLENLKRSPLAN